MNDIYADCTLFELYELLHANTKIECPMSLETLAMQAEKANIMPKDLEVSQPPIWLPEKGRYDEYSITICDENDKVIFRIMEDDIIIMPDDTRNSRCQIQEFFLDDKDDVDAGIYYIEDDDMMRDMLTVALVDLETNEEFTMSAWDFLIVVDCEDIVYEKSRWFKYMNK